MKQRTYRVGAFGSYWYTYSLVAALTLIDSLRRDYGPSPRFTLASLWLAPFELPRAS